MTSQHPFEHVPVIHRYTRAQAIDDGVLVDLTEWASETGFPIPLACTAELWSKYIVPPDCTREAGQSERGRAHDLLWMLHCAIKRSAASKTGAEQIMFEVIFLQEPRRHETVSLRAICGPGDDAEPVLTVMLPHED